MKKKLILLFVLFIPIVFLFGLSKEKPKAQENIIASKKSHWFILHRKSERELLYYGVFGDVNNSRLIKTFQVKPGSPSSPTPLPKLLGRDYWLIIKKESSAGNLETAPYFLMLDVPVSEDWPYGPVPYEECNGQCDWILPGYFGLHGVNGNSAKLAPEDLGSSGCIRHSDFDITYLYNLLTPESEEIRYYIEDI